ncbi:hypothetical protein BC828DRAFT_374226 [Blastocladiella britannica]|nr:hypothetical protein BC828DRAFT_374226 [Blastocladiella britannica]
MAPPRSVASAKKAKAKARAAAHASARAGPAPTATTASSSTASASVETTTTTTEPPCALHVTNLSSALTATLQLLDTETAVPTLALDDDAFDAAHYASQLRAVGMHIKHGITKFALLHKEGGAAGPSAAASAEEVKNCATLAMQLYAHVATLPESRGAHLRSLHLSTARDILLALRALADGFLVAYGATVPTATETSEGDRKLGQHLLDTGIAWNCAETLKALPLTNRAAVALSWKAHVGLARDVAAEVKESVAEYEENDGDDDVDDFSSDDDSASGDDERSAAATDAVDPQEKAAQLARMAVLVKLATLAQSLSSRLSATLESSSDDTTTDVDAIRALDSLPPAADTLAAALDELGAAVAMPPLPAPCTPDARELRHHLLTVLGTWSMLLTNKAGAWTDAPWISGAVTSLDRARDAVNGEFPVDGSEQEE